MFAFWVSSKEDTLLKIRTRHIPFIIIAVANYGFEWHCKVLIPWKFKMGKSTFIIKEEKFINIEREVMLIFKSL